MKTQKFINSNPRKVLSLALTIILATSNFLLQGQNKKDALKPQVFHIQNYFQKRI